MRKSYGKLLVFFAAGLVTPGLADDQPPKYRQPLQKEYVGEDDILGKNRLFATGAVAEGAKLRCDMGQALPDPERKDWYINKPISGLVFEAEPVAVNLSEHESIADTTYGWIVIKKNDEVLILFKPLGSDWFSAWANEGATEYNLNSALMGDEGYANFDLLDGLGFYYRTRNQDGPSYFLSNCTRSKVANLPVYEYEFE